MAVRFKSALALLVVLHAGYGNAGPVDEFLWYVASETEKVCKNSTELTCASAAISNAGAIQIAGLPGTAHPAVFSNQHSAHAVTVCNMAGDRFVISWGKILSEEQAVQLMIDKEWNKSQTFHLADFVNLITTGKLKTPAILPAVLDYVLPNGDLYSQEHHSRQHWRPSPWARAANAAPKLLGGVGAAATACASMMRVSDVAAVRYCIIDAKKGCPLSNQYVADSLWPRGLEVCGVETFVPHPWGNPNCSKKAVQLNPILQAANDGHIEQAYSPTWAGIASICESVAGIPAGVRSLLPDISTPPPTSSVDAPSAGVPHNNCNSRPPPPKHAGLPDLRSLYDDYHVPLPSPLK